MLLSLLAPICALLCAFIFFSQVQALLRNVSRQLSLRIWSPLFSIVAKPQELAEIALLSAARKEMRAAGFVYTHTRRYRDPCFSQYDFPQVCDVYYHPERDVHAHVFPASYPHKAAPCYEVELTNTYIDGSSILTIWRGSARFFLLPNTTKVVRARLPDVHNLLQAHLRRRQHIASVRTVASDALMLARTWSERMVLWLVHEGKLSLTAQRHNGRDLFRLSVATAAKLAWQEWQAAVWRTVWFIQNLGRSPKTARDDAAFSTELMLQAQQLVVRQHWAYAESRKTPRWLTFAPSALSGCALLLISGWLGGTPALLAAALVLAWYFLSFLLLMGVHHMLKRKQKSIHPLWVLVAQLARPALALLVASAILLALVLDALPKEPVLLWGALLAIAFNLLQLLPLRPFLGGQIVESLSSWSLPRIVLLLGVAAACATLGIYYSRYGFLLLTALLVLCVPRLWHQVRARAHWRHAQQSATPLPSLMQSLARARLCTNAGRIALARAAARQARTLGATASMFGFALYTSCLVMPLFVLITLLLAFPSRSLSLWQETHLLVRVNKAESVAATSPPSNKLTQAKLRKEAR